MVRSFTKVFPLLLLLLSIPAAFCDSTLDPTGFCNVPANATACSTPTGLSGHTISVNATSFGMFKTGGGTGLSNVPWFLLVVVPENSPGTAVAPTITSASFTQQGTTQDVGVLTQTTAPGTSIYDIAGVTGDSSMNAPNLFCDGNNGFPPTCTSSNEISARGSLPNDFEIFKYTFSPAFDSATAYAFSVGGSGLTAGTYLAASGGSNPFSTPFTVTGLVHGPVVTPEPASLALFGTGLFGLAGVVRRRRTMNK